MLDHLSDAIDVALSATLDLEHASRPQRVGKSPPEAIVVGHPVKRRRRDDRVNRLIEVEHVLAPDLCAVAEPTTRKRHHVSRRVDRQHAAFRHACQQCLRDAPGAATDIQHRRVRRNAVEP
jgi:hypothetical protein